jgi:hypothetical protein
MKTLIATIVLLLLALTPIQATPKNKSDQYKLGVYVSFQSVSDGTVSDYSRCGTAIVTACNLDVRVNGVIRYTLRGDDGTWVLETYRQFEDSVSRQYGLGEPTHFKSEKPNPLDFMKRGDKVLFRVEVHKKLFGTEVDVFIPYAENPDKEAKFVGTFTSNVQAPRPAPPSDNVKAMCDNHKLSPALEAQYCKP